MTASISNRLLPDAAATPAASATIPGAVRSTLAFVPVAVSDAEARTQWHFSMLGDVEALWPDFTGRTVSVGVYDSGVQYDHWDLAPNYDASKHVVVDGYQYDGDFHPASGPHGTAVAGIIGAARNGRGPVGIAHEASLTGVNIFNPFSYDGSAPGIFVNAADNTQFYEAMYQAASFDVVNHSWGGRGAYGSRSSRDVEGTSNWKMTQTIAYAAAEGRGGLGTISVSASGNTIVPGIGSVDDQSDAWKSDRHVINVGAYRGNDGSSTYYSTHGAHLLISAPSGELGPFDLWRGIGSTDVMGRAGYNLRAAPGGNSDVTDRFSGTSAATPIVTGVVALMLDANEQLGWRDVSNIIAASAKMPVSFGTGQTYATALYDAPLAGIVKGEDYILNSSSFKLGGAAANWNGGRMHYSTDYGYGAIDAYAAVRMAEVWGLFGAPRTTANERSLDTGLIAVSIAPPENGDMTVRAAFNDFLGKPVGLDVVVETNIAAEHIDLRLTFDTMRYGDFYAHLANVRFKVTAPDGTSAFVDTYGAEGWTASDPQEFTFGLAAFRGVETAGTWRVEFEAFNDEYDARTTITGVQLKGYGSAAGADDVHTFTDELFAMTAIRGESGRRVLGDNDGGTDWINAAAVTADVSLSLTAGQRATFDGRHAFTLARDSAIEHAVTGDGDDRLIGNALDNRLYGMRGDDWLNGRVGDDTLFGGQGRDVFAFDTFGVSGHDRILDWSAGDRIATSRQLKGEDVNGLLTLGSSALLLLDGNARGDTAHLVDQGGAVLRAMGRSEGYWWYGFVTPGDEGHVDGRIRESFLHDGAGDGVLATRTDQVPGGTDATDGAAATAEAFYLYDTMGDAMTSGVQVYA